MAGRRWPHRAAGRALIADPGNDVLVSLASLWRIVVQLRVGKLDADLREVLAAIGRDGFALLPVSPARLLALAALPAHHRDPFDHLLIAQAVAEGATFLSQDQNTPRHPVQVLACSDASAGSGC